MSSAYLMTRVDLDIQLKVLTTKEKRAGPSTEPCGTPDVTGRRLEIVDPMRTHWNLSDR